MTNEVERLVFEPKLYNTNNSLEKTNPGERQRHMYFKAAIDILRIFCSGSRGLWAERTIGCGVLQAGQDFSEVCGKENHPGWSEVRGGGPSATLVGHSLWYHWGYLPQRPRPLCHQTQLLMEKVPHQTWILTPSQHAFWTLLLTSPLTLWWPDSDPVNQSLSFWCSQLNLSWPLLLICHVHTNSKAFFCPSHPECPLLAKTHGQYQGSNDQSIFLDSAFCVFHPESFIGSGSFVCLPHTR